jgi:predicted nuclease of predicted toxin-antitoxin system
LIRLLLDVHYSRQRIGRVLTAEGFNVRAAVDDASLEELPDDELLAVAIAEQRIMVTADTGDFNQILVQLAQDAIDHTGVILVPSSIPNNAYGAILESLREALRSTQSSDWVNRVIWLPRIRT